MPAAASERDRLLSPPPSPRPRSRPQRLGAFLLQPLAPAHADLTLLACCLVTGLTDAAAYRAWSTFLSMQTGNTVFLALGIAALGTGEDAYEWLRSLTSILSFIVGCAVYSRAMKRAGHGGLVRGALAGSFVMQAAFICVAAGLVRGEVIPVPGKVAPAQLEATDPMLKQLAGIGLLAFQAGGQIVVSRVFGFGELPTVVLTSGYCDLVSDDKLFQWRNQKRDRRALAVCLILAGGILGGWVTRTEGGLDDVLWVAAGMKFVMAIAFLFWKTRPDPE